MRETIKALISKTSTKLIEFYNEIVSFSLDNVFELLHTKFQKRRWLKVLFYFFKDHCPQRAASLSFYVITYMVSGVFLLIFIGHQFDIEFAENVVKSLLNFIIPSEISLTTDYIVTFTTEILEHQSYLYIASGIALFNIFFLLIEIKEHFDEILDHYYIKSAGMFIWHQFLKIFFSICFLGLFHFILQPIISEVSQITFGAMFAKYGILFGFLWILFLHSSNSQKLPVKVTIKGALLSTGLLWVLDYVIFDVISQKHSFYGADNHSSSLGIIFLFPFWIYLAWNIVFIGLEYIASYTKHVSQKYPFAYKQFIKLSILELLSNDTSLHSEIIVKRFGINYRYFQTVILHGLLLDKLVVYDRKTDSIYGTEGWLEKNMFDYFEFEQLIVNQQKSEFVSLIKTMNEETRKSLTFEMYFKHSYKADEEKDESLWDKFRGFFTTKKSV